MTSSSSPPPSHNPKTVKTYPPSAARPTRTSRRGFLCQSALAGGALLLLAPRSRAAGADPTAAGPENETLKTIHRLHTTHGNFRDQPLPEETLRTILRACVRAAGASNNQSYSIIVVKEPARMKQLCGYAGSCLLLFCADYNRMKASAAALGYDYQPGTVVDFVNASINTLLVVQTAVIAARALGVDSLLTNGVHRGDMERHWKLLDLPATHCFPLLALVLGYADREPAARTGRLDGLGVVHQDQYHHLTKEETDRIIRQYDDKDRHLGLNTDWDAQGYAHYLDWYFKAWVGRNLKPGTQETQMLRLLKRSGFIENQPG